MFIQIPEGFEMREGVCFHERRNRKERCLLLSYSICYCFISPLLFICLQCVHIYLLRNGEKSVDLISCMCF